jgi:hypothetical protein
MMQSDAVSGRLKEMQKRRTHNFWLAHLPSVTASLSPNSKEGCGVILPDILQLVLRLDEELRRGWQVP